MGCQIESILIVFSLLQVLILSRAYTGPLTCTDTVRLCTSFLAFKPSSDETLPVILSMFDVLQEDLTVEGNDRDYIFIKKNCSCASGLKKYLTDTTYTVRENNGSVYDLVMDSYHGLSYFPSNFTREARRGAVVSLRLMCGCSSGLWNYLMSYVLQDGDSVESLASRFGVSMDSIVTVNGISNPDNFTLGGLYYIPLNSVPGEPYPLENETLLAPAPTPSADTALDDKVDHRSHVPYWWIIGSLVVGLALIIVVLLVFVSIRSQRTQPKDYHCKISHKFLILRKACFCCKSEDWDQPRQDSSNRQIDIPTVIGKDMFDVEKPVVFKYEEIMSSTDGFSDSNLLGHGTYGSVYYALLQDQEVAIKKMTATKTKEFMAEMKVLCKVHHTNLVELIGYAASEDELFLIYEYAQKGSLGSHLHDPHSKGLFLSFWVLIIFVLDSFISIGQTPLSWITRVQIALDAARGLEYIHEHTKPHYVHRDIKTSNLLLDGNFRAKISDFGLAKLVMTTNDMEQSVTRVVGTYGYLAPEYLRDGIASNKSDIYAFGVVLFEMVTGKEAMTRTAERRSLASIMVGAMRSCADSTTMWSLREHIDPNLMDLYPHDCLFKMAMLAKQCVEDDPILRPDMKQVVISLSQILLSSVEWEATLAGSSQVFSGLVQGR